MPRDSDSAAPLPAVTFRYRLLRALVRFCLTVRFRRIRLLNPQVLPQAGAAMLAAGPPTGFLEPLVLVAAFERQIYCLLDSSLVSGGLRRFLAWGLKMIACAPGEEKWPAAVQASCELLAGNQALAVFPSCRALTPGMLPPLGQASATVALEAESNHAGELGLSVFPLFLFMPTAISRTKEILIFVGSPLFPLEYLPSAGSPASRSSSFVSAIESVCRQNVFGLRPEELKQFLADLEDVLRNDLEEVWAERPDWKQKMTGFELSGFVRDLAGHLNSLQPARLVALRESLNEYREARRRWSLRQFEIESASGWLESSRLRARRLAPGAVPGARRLRRMRKQLIAQLDAARDQYAEMLGIAR